MLASVEDPSLRAVHVSEDGSLEGLEALHVKLDPAKFLECGVVLLAHLLGLLVAFIGPTLTLRMIGEIWPNISFDDTDLG